MSDRLSLIPSCSGIASSSLAAASASASASPSFRGCHVADRVAESPSCPLCVLALVSNFQFRILRRCHRLHRRIVVVSLLLLWLLLCPVADLLPTPIRAKETKSKTEAETKPSCAASSGHLAVMRLNYTSDFHCSALISAR